MSLRSGGKIATTVQPIINPNNLKIEGFYCTDSVEKNKQLVLVEPDIRDIIPAGIVVNDHSVLSEADDLIRLKPIMDLNFTVLDKPVVTVSKQKLGKVTDYATEPKSMLIKKLYVTQSLVRSLSGKSLGIDRTQIVEITSRKIVVQDLLQPTPARGFSAEPANA